jgi:GT2 family glycosyltransferase
MPDDYEEVINRAVFLQNEENIGCLPMLRQALPYIEDDDIVVFMHNDVLIWDKDWDEFVRDAFEQIGSLGLAGLFGAPGMALDGGRMFARSQMAGKEWGTEGHLHGAIMGYHEISPAVVLDSLCMIFRGNALREVGIPDEWPPHHWFDRMFCLRFIDAGWSVAVLGIPFDHYGGGSGGPTMDNFAKKWVKENMGIETDDVEKANNKLYIQGLSQFHRDYGARLPIVVDGEFDYVWKKGPFQ